MTFQPGKNSPTIFIIFGATGDLMARKLLPALFHLFATKQLPDYFQIVGFSRRDLSDAEFQAMLEAALAKHQASARSPALRKRFVRLVRYVQGNFDVKADYDKLAAQLQAIDQKWGLCSSKLFHLAVPPHLYETILERLAHSGLTKGCGPEGGWMRVIVEKPFGKDLKTAERLDALLGKLFREEQVYRIDHYLGKAMLHNILAFRFSNKLFEESWDRDSIERVQIRLLEKDGVEERGAFYDGVGALRDVGQNHMLQMLALTTMDSPRQFNADGIRSQRAELLRALAPLRKKAMLLQAYRAQYAGYRQERGVDPTSVTETYFEIYAKLDSPRWRAVPIILEGGKATGKSEKDIRVIFKHPKPCLCGADAKHEFRNEVIFELEPEEAIRIKFWAKKPGLTMELEQREFHLPYYEKKVGRIEEYAKLLYDCIAGDQTLFVSTDEVRSMWRFIDPIVCAWQKNLVPLRSYKSGQVPVI